MTNLAQSRCCWKVVEEGEEGGNNNKRVEENYKLLSSSFESMRWKL